MKLRDFIVKITEKRDRLNAILDGFARVHAEDLDIDFTLEASAAPDTPKRGHKPGRKAKDATPPQSDTEGD